MRAPAVALHLCHTLQDYISALQPKGIKLAVLNLYDQQQEQMMDRINSLWAAAADHAETLSKEHAAELSKVVAKLIAAYLEQELQLAAKAAAETAAALQAPNKATSNVASGSNSSSNQVLPAIASSAASPAASPALLVPSVSQQPYLLPQAVLCKGLAELGAITYDAASRAGGAEPAAMYRHSPPGCRIPFAEAVTSSTHSNSSSSSDYHQLQSQIDEVQSQLAEYCSNKSNSSLHSPAMQHVQQLWQEALARPAVQGQVNRLVEVLEGAVLPHNKHTRRRAAESGPSLYLPGLVKAASSNYTSQKIFASKTAGGKRTYQVALLLDVSQSMQGHLQQCSLEVLASLADALGKVGLDDFAVMTFGAAPVLVKAPDTAWDAASQLALLEQVNCRAGEGGREGRGVGD